MSDGLSLLGSVEAYQWRRVELWREGFEQHGNYAQTIIKSDWREKKGNCPPPPAKKRNNEITQHCCVSVFNNAMLTQDKYTERSIETQSLRQVQYTLQKCMGASRF